MRNKRLWIALLAIPICLASLLIIGAQRSHPASAGGAIDPTCTISSSPCIQYTNNSSGAGIEGLSLLGNGLFGVTKFNSTSASNGKSGVFGNDLSSSGLFDSGVSGLSVRGAGVLGKSSSGLGVSGTSTSNAGLMGLSTSNNGVFGDSKAPGASGVYGQNDGGGFGVAGRLTRPGLAAGFFDAGSTGSVALSSQSLNGVSANVVGGSGGFPELSIVGGSDFINACPSSTANPCDRLDATFYVLVSGEVFGSAAIFQLGTDRVFIGNGNVDISGQYEKNGGCVLGCSVASATSQGRAVVSYVPTQSLPTIDDFGEATLQNGYAYVRLDPAFANVIDQRAAYLVFITPEGDSRGLYVTQKSGRGFAVHENMGGHSSIAFSYRIVAKPLGKQERRLPMVALPKSERRPFPVPTFHRGAVG